MAINTNTYVDGLTELFKHSFGDNITLYRSAVDDSIKIQLYLTISHYDVLNSTVIESLKEQLKALPIVASLIPKTQNNTNSLPLEIPIADSLTEL